MTRLAVAMLAANVLSLSGFSTYAAVLPVLREVWAISNTEAGWIASGFFIGYVATVSAWSAVTDSIDARRVYVAGSVLAAAGSFAFALFAGGFASALAAQVLLGTGTAASYMPGLRILSDRAAGPRQSRYISFYTSFFGVGVAVSLWIAGYALAAAGWRAAFALSGFGPLIAAVLVIRGTRTADPGAGRPAATTAAPAGRSWASKILPLTAWGRVLSNRDCLTYTIGYGVHCMELFGMRAWIVAFLAYTASLRSGPALLMPTTAMALASLFSAPASILGNECALRLGRRRWIHAVMSVTGLLGVAMAAIAAGPWMLIVLLMLLYSMGIMADSATLTAGLVAAAPADVKGAALGLYSLIGFGLGGVLGPAIFGLTLDLTGSWPGQSWVAAFLVLGLPCLAFPWMDRQRSTKPV